MVIVGKEVGHQVLHWIVVQFCQVQGLSHHLLSVLLRKHSQEKIVMVVGIIASMASELLLTHVSVHRPYLIVITGILELFVLCCFQLLLLLADHILYHVHGDEIDVVEGSPPIMVHLSPLELILQILVWSLDGLQEFIEPIIH